MSRPADIRLRRNANCLNIAAVRLNEAIRCGGLLRVFRLPNTKFVAELSWHLANRETVTGKGRTPAEAQRFLGAALERQLNG